MLHMDMEASFLLASWTDITMQVMENSYIKDVQILQKSRSSLKILGTRRVT